MINLANNASILAGPSSKVERPAIPLTEVGDYPFFFKPAAEGNFELRSPAREIYFCSFDQGDKHAEGPEAVSLLLDGVDGFHDLAKRYPMLPVSTREEAELRVQNFIAWGNRLFQADPYVPFRHQGIEQQVRVEAVVLYGSSLALNPTDIDIRILTDYPYTHYHTENEVPTNPLQILMKQAIEDCGVLPTSLSGRPVQSFVDTSFFYDQYPLTLSMNSPYLVLLRPCDSTTQPVFSNTSNSGEYYVKHYYRRKGLG